MRMIPKIIRNMFAADTRVAAGMVDVQQQMGYGSVKPDLYADQAFISTIGYLTGLPDPDIVLRNAGLTRRDLKQIETDDEVYGALETRLDAVLATPHRFEGTEGKQFDFVKAEVEKHLRTILSCAWKAVPYGYSVAECVYEHRDNGEIGILKLEEKPLEWFKPNIDNTLILFSPFQGQQLVDTKYKFFLTRRQHTYINPYGEALLSRLYWPWFFRQNGWRWWCKWLDRHGDNLLIGSGIDKPKQLVDALTVLGIDNFIAVGVGQKIEAIMPHGTDVFERFDSVISSRIQKLILGQTLTSDNANGGSNALGEVHERVRTDKRNSDLVLVTETVQNVINALVDLNFGADAPRITYIMQDELGIEADRANRDATLAKSGIVKFTKEYLCRVYDFEEGDIDVPTIDAQVQLAKVNPVTGGQVPGSSADATVVPTPAQTKVPTAVKKTKTAAEIAAELLFASANPTFTQDQLAIEAIANEAIAAAKPAIDIKDIRACIFGARDAADLKDRLTVLLQDCDPSSFASTLERAMIAADVLGYVQAAA